MPFSAKGARREIRVLRGGSWVDVPGLLRASYRGRAAPDGRVSGVGFRILQDVEEQ